MAEEGTHSVPPAATSTGQPYCWAEGLVAAETDAVSRLLEQRSHFEHIFTMQHR